MKRFKLLLVALATVSFTAFYACNGGEHNDETNDSVTVEKPTEEPKIEEETTPDSTEVVMDSTKVMTEEEAPVEETKVEEETK